MSACPTQTAKPQPRPGVRDRVAEIASNIAKPFRERARQQLENVRAEGLRDAETSLGLAEIYSAEDPTLAAAFAKETLDEKDAPANVRALALMVLAATPVHGGATSVRRSVPSRS